MKDTIDDINPRKEWLGTLAKSPEGRVGALLDQVMARPDFTWLRMPEIGSVMVRGRAGATGSPFNLGEVTVTRCSLRLADGTVGHGYVQGRRKACAEAAALVDALMQTENAADIRVAVLNVLEAERTEARTTRAAKAAATKVDFFTMVRGED
ncbi:alpha-D-ribose 1-methylphosphonate 5-triphosphate synthase subunit PhnG [Sulfitobacter undariae]|uniref:Alpha-D-ribose 1-methylphosphonate 5-triphosphate synthase subunit PhnG n=1 Tax=Sulfitobacter undariae TaxID=1563671 RepID=A0A7W6E641_9RHOB|nr:phosphonate C-P lyase system protein PhnG [Sulfitobacter undariae]MBB3995425.1 alpha-D-ribose 1-methylphosphonate 5-triphosphate synthase subunit PhnG [Sulfitobacter undariae]